MATRKKKFQDGGMRDGICGKADKTTILFHGVLHQLSLKCLYI